MAGDYVYLTRGLGRKAGFLFAWAEFWVVRPGNIGALAYVFADYANRLVAHRRPVTAAVWWPTPWRPSSILSGINILGVREGKWTQNLLTAGQGPGTGRGGGGGVLLRRPGGRRRRSPRARP